MNRAKHRPTPFPPINRHGIIGDRRTGALVAADGTIDWFCVPEFDGALLFGSLLEPEEGGFCRFGPIRAALGHQRYLLGTAAVETGWPPPPGKENAVMLTDLMTWPDDRREESNRHQRVIVRRLKKRGTEAIHLEARPRWELGSRPDFVAAEADGVVFGFPGGQLTIWSSFPMRIEDDAAIGIVDTARDLELWVVMAWNSKGEKWTPAKAEEAFEATVDYWRDWTASLTFDFGPSCGTGLRRSAITVHLLTHAEHDCPISALTTSLPERIGGDRNYDYRFAWVRDASLSLAFLARLGRVDEVQQYLDWLCTLSSSTQEPLQTCYRLNGATQLDESELSGVRGYADSRPVRRGNRAARQRQLGSLAFLADCARIYVENNGFWQDRYWQLIRRSASYICDHWHLTDSGVWELPVEAHYVASKVMSWVVLDRAKRIFDLTGLGDAKEVDRWSAVGRSIHAEVMKKGWDQQRRSFVQRYDSKALDAALLLIPLMDFLPPDHERVLGTLTAIEHELIIDGLVHRFDPTATLGGKQLSIQEYEAGFLPATFWWVHALAKAGRTDDAEAVLSRCETIAGELGVFAEEADAGRQIFLGNTPLLFAQVEYARALCEVARSRDRATELKKI